MGRENAGMSSVLHVEIMHTVSLRVPKQGLSSSGQSGLRRTQMGKPMDNRFIFLYHSTSFHLSSWEVVEQWGDAGG